MTGPFGTQPVAKIPRQDHSPSRLKIVVWDTTWEHLPFPFRCPIATGLPLGLQLSAERHEETRLTGRAVRLQMILGANAA